MSKDFENLGFERMRMVEWMHPVQLLRTGLRALVSAMFGAYADRRELQAALDRESKDFDYSDRDEIWIDHVADTGDGFDSTYTVARVVSEDELVLKRDRAEHRLKRGEVLVFGGDQVYPVASGKEYRRRFRKPWEHALPAEGEVSKGHLFALPGNHDWYDGLTSFLRQFCQEWNIGARKTQQKRSYFALKLPHGWWLWGVDLQFGADIDVPQRHYFREIAENDKRMPKGARVVLVLPEPVWLAKDHQRARMASWFIDEHILRYGHEVQVVIAGDLHCYARWSDVSPSGRTKTQWILSGGGGAYLYPTHHLPGFAEGESGCDSPLQVGASPLHQLTAEAVYPSVDDSKRLARGALLFLFKPGNYYLGLMFGAVFVLLAWAAGVYEGRADLWSCLLGLPGGALTLAGVVGAFVAWARFDKLTSKVIAGTLHAAVHLAVWSLLSTLLAALLHNPPTLDRATELMEPVGARLVAGSWLFLLSFSVILWLVGGLLAGLAIGVYLWTCDKCGGHANDVLVCQSIPDFKSFLRMHIDSKGTLRIYAVGIDKVEHAWRVNSAAVPPAHAIDAAEAIADRARLVDGPVVLHGVPENGV